MRLKAHLESTMLCAILLVCSIQLTTVSAQSISCIQSINVSLDQDCQMQLSADDILTLQNGPDTYTLEVYTGNDLVPNSLLTIDHLWTTVTVKVMASNGNSCWAEVNVEDKLGPDIVCSDLEIECYDMKDYLPEATDNCSSSPVEVTILDNEIENFICNDVYLKRLTQTYQAIDNYGNASSCSRSIFLKRFDMSSIVFPPDYKISNNTNLTCSQLTDEGDIDLKVTQVPMANGVEIFPLVDSYCNVGVSFSDFVVKDGCVKSIMRTWYVAEWACVANQDTNHVQVIEILDEEPPTIIDCLTSAIVLADPNPGCAATVTLPLPSVEDDCFGAFEFDVTYEGGFLNNVTSDVSINLEGTSTVRFTVYDQCDNISTCETLVQVQDGVAPVAICDEQSVVSLRSDGTALALPQTFDDGSFDNCAVSTMLIKREMDPSIDACPCERPTFSDLSFVGSYNGHHYYVSNKEFTAIEAVQLSTAYGDDGESNLVYINDLDEAAWISEALNSESDSIYIGLKFKGDGLPFSYYDHSTLTYSEWASGQVGDNGVPLVSGEFVALNEDRTWEIVSGNNRLPFLLEVNSDCGFSEVVHFCCTDAGSSHSVRLRVIDAFGLVNECTSTIAVQDKIAPVISCPSDSSFDCAVVQDFTDNSVWGIYTATDQCSISIDNLAIDDSGYNVACGSGEVLRTFIVSDASQTSASCTQTLSAHNGNTFSAVDIIWPADLDVETCLDSYVDPAISGFPIIPTTACTNVLISEPSDQTFDFPSGDFQKIIRTWQVVDHCAPNGSQTYTWEQSIKIDVVGVAPSVVCNQSVTASVQANPSTPNMPMVVVDPSLFIQSVDNACMANIEFSFTLLSDVVSNSTVGRMYTCADVGSTFEVPIYIYADGVLLATHTPLLTIDDSLDACKGNGGQSILLSGCDADVFEFVDCQSQSPMVQFNIAAENSCLLPDNFMYSVAIDYFRDGSVDIVEMYTSASDYQYFLETQEGHHQIDITVMDACGNVGRCIKFFSVVCSDSNQGEIVINNCINETGFISCDENGFYQVNADAFIDSTSSCADDITLFAQIDLNSDGIVDYVEGGYSSYVEVYIAEPGFHTISYTASGCGTEASCTKFVTLECQITAPVLQNCQTENVFISCNEGEEFVVTNFVDSGFGPCLATEIIANVDLFSDGLIDYVVDGVDIVDVILSDEGSHTITYIATNSCGLLDTCDKLVIVDCFDSLAILDCFDESLEFDCTHAVDYPFIFTVDYFGSGCSTEPFLRASIDFDSNGTIDTVFQSFDFYLEYFIDIPGIHNVLLEAFVCGEVASCNKVITLDCIDTFTLSSCSDTNFSIPCNQNVSVPIDLFYQHFDCNEPAVFTVEVDMGSTGSVDQTILDQGFSFESELMLPQGTHAIRYVVNSCGLITECVELITITCIEGTMGVVSGRVVTEDLIPVAEVVVDLEGAGVPLEDTDLDGQYVFPAMPMGGAYRVSPSKDVDYLDGISTLDLIKIQRHLLGIQKLDSPYKLIAADIDRSGSINGIDLVELRKLILGVYSELPNNTSWRMIDATQDFSGMPTPFIASLKEEYTIHNLETDMVVDFIGVKVGDVDNSIELLESTNTDLRQTNKSISIEELSSIDGVKKYVISGAENADVDGFQFALNVYGGGAKILEIVPLAEGLDYDNFNLHSLQRGEVNVSWNNNSPMRFDQNLFEITVLQNANVNDRVVIELGENLQSELYFNDTVYGLELEEVTEDVEVITLYQNNPNPWSEYTEIKFKMPTDNDISLSVYDLNGQLIYQELKRANKGLNISRISKYDLNGSGVLYYELISDDKRYVQKMILID